MSEATEPAPDDPPFTLEGTIKRGLTPRQGPTRKSHLRLFTAIACRCYECGKPILRVVKYPECILVAIEPRSWDGNIYYVKGVHECHLPHCAIGLARLLPPKELDLRI